LKYLIALEKGETDDRSGLTKISLWRVHRELDGFEDHELLESLTLVDDEVKKMISEKNSKSNK
jgi:hypothetical protein